VPVSEAENFEDYYLEFSLPCHPDRVGFTPAVFLSGQDEAYPLADGTRIDLNHELFDEDAIILKNMAREVTLKSRVSSHSVTVSYPQMPYLGIWHWPKTDAPYVCIEPWTSLPSRQDVVEEFTCKSDLVQLTPGCVYDNTWTITIGRK
jgi:galactose mutarotase-like enzyme